MDENDPIWPIFEAWHAKYKAALEKAKTVKHETAVIEVMKELNDEMLALKRAVNRVHEAKGRYHSQIAMCDLYDLCKLTNERPTK